MARLPQSPPAFVDLLQRVGSDGFRLAATTHLSDDYLHWEELRRREPPKDFSHDVWWLALKLRRQGMRRAIALTDTQGRPFSFTLPDRLQLLLHQIDMGGGASILVPQALQTSELQDTYRVSQRIEEAFTSSQIEGAVTTRAVAKEMLRTARPPRDRSERMIANNYRAMLRIREIASEPLRVDRVIELQCLLTESTLEHPGESGRFRHAEEPIVVGDFADSAIVYHRPPPAALLPQRMETLCAFANQTMEGDGVHPIVRAILLHLWLAYDHPFCDGNGRTARALFYWCLLHNGYWLAEYLSISRTIHRSRRRYYDAFLFVETDENDATYFLMDQTKTLEKALQELYLFIERRARRMHDAERRLRALPGLNFRQKALLEHALRHPGFRYTIEGHRRSHDVVYATARADLLDLAGRELLRSRKDGRALVFTATEDLTRRLAVD